MRGWFLFLAILFFMSSFAYEVQDDAVVFSTIIEGTGSIENAHSVIESFFASYYNDVNSALKLNRSDALMYKGLFVGLGSFAMGAWTIDATHLIDVSIKDGRVRVKVSVSDAVMRSTTGSHYCFDYSVPNSPPFAPKCSNKSVNKKYCDAAFSEIVLRSEALLAAVVSAFQSITADDDW